MLTHEMIADMLGTRRSGVINLKKKIAVGSGAKRPQNNSEINLF